MQFLNQGNKKFLQALTSQIQPSYQLQIGKL